MPNIWDAKKLSTNLDVIASLHPSVTGQKLDIQATGDLAVYKPSTGAIQAFRRWSSPSVTSIETFHKPLKKLFDEARKSKDISTAKIENAIKGLKALRLSYSASKLASLNQLIREIQAQSAQPQALLAFHQPFQKYSRLAFAQAHFLGGENEGICMALTYFWIKKRVNDEDWSYTVTGIAEKAEELKKIQSAYEKIGSGGRLDKRIAALAEEIDSEDTLELTNPRIDGCDKVIGSSDKGGAIFKRIVTTCRTLRGDQLFFLTYEGSNPHAVGLDLRSHSITLFDANFGEFRFPASDADKFLEFCDSMWEKVKPPGTFYWDIVQVTK